MSIYNLGNAIKARLAAVNHPLATNFYWHDNLNSPVNANPDYFYGGTYYTINNNQFLKHNVLTRIYYEIRWINNDLNFQLVFGNNQDASVLRKNFITYLTQQGIRNILLSKVGGYYRIITPIRENSYQTNWQAYIDTFAKTIIDFYALMQPKLIEFLITQGYENLIHYEIPILAEQTKIRFWRIGTESGSTGESQWNLMKENNYVAIGWGSDLGDLGQYNTERFVDIIKTHQLHHDKGTNTRKAGEIKNFYLDIQKGDVVFACEGESILGLGIVTGNYHYNSVLKFRHTKSVKWIYLIDTVTESLYKLKGIGLRTTVYEIEILEFLRSLNTTQLEEINELFAKNNINIPQITHEIAKAMSLPNFPLNRILYGAPGTGKTYNSISKAVEIIDEEFYKQNKDINQRKELNEKFKELRGKGRIAFVTFHQNYSYEDFMVGIKPKIGKETDNLQFETNEGVFYKLCTEAKKYPKTPYVIIIDEINRANISRVFGELITLLEPDKRIDNENELLVTLPNGEPDFGVPNNLYIIGTMNTADKSISLLDIALRRRFEFVPYMPDYKLVTDEIKRKLLEHLNKGIFKIKNSTDFLLGHSFFMNETDVKEVLHNKIIPLLMEYFLGKIDVVESLFVAKENGGFEVKFDSEKDYCWKVNGE